jgi:hypothetical protein
MTRAYVERSSRSWGGQMTFEINKVTPSTAPFHTPEAFTPPPSARPLVRSDTLGSYAKAEQHGDGCCAKLLTVICTCVTFPFKLVWSCVSGCFKGLCGSGKSAGVQASSDTGLTPSGQLFQVLDEETFNRDFWPLTAITGFLRHHNMENGEFPKLTTGKGLYNCIHVIYVCCHRKKEVMNSLVEHVVSGIHDKEFSGKIFNFEERTIKSLDEAEANRVYVFVYRCISRILEREEVNENILDSLSLYNFFLFDEIVRDEKFLKSLQPGQKERLISWVGTTKCWKETNWKLIERINKTKEKTDGI